MPELPDITIYVEALRERILGTKLLKVRCLSPFVLRSVDPPLSSFASLSVQAIERLGKRIAIGFEAEHFLVIHLMISGRLLWKDASEGVPKTGGKQYLAVIEFESGYLLLTEASSHKRATLHVVRGRDNQRLMAPQGIEPLECTLEQFHEALIRENRTLKRALTNPQTFSGIGNSYSDEILHRARLSPVRLTQALKPEEADTLFHATREVLSQWIQKLRDELHGKFPGKGEVTAFRPDFAAHGKFGKPCPDCGLPIQRIQYAENETNYCAKCQNEGRVLADRSLSRLLKDDWPKTILEMVGE